MDNGSQVTPAAAPFLGTAQAWLYLQRLHWWPGATQSFFPNKNHKFPSLFHKPLQTKDCSAEEQSSKKIHPTEE